MKSWIKTLGLGLITAIMICLAARAQLDVVPLPIAIPAYGQ